MPRSQVFVFTGVNFNYIAVLQGIGYFLYRPRKDPGMKTPGALVFARIKDYFGYFAHLAKLQKQQKRRVFSIFEYMHLKRYIIILVLAMPVVSYCQSHYMPYRREVLPKIAAKIYALYPHASNIRPADNSHIHDSIQLVKFKCNCPEDLNRFYITFDTNGNLLRKDIDISIKYLPQSIAAYIKRDTAKCYIYSDRITKSINNKGEVFYCISKWQEIEGPSVGNWIYILKFKASGEYVSTEKRWQNI